MRAAFKSAATVARLVSFVCCLLLAAQYADAAPSWTDLGTATNDTDPSIWESKSFDVTSPIATATSATLYFDLRNDWNSPGITTSKVEFGVEGVDYFARFTYVSGDDTSHWRNVFLNIDGLLYVDQYGAFNNHMGDTLLGTAQQGGQGDPGIYVLRQETSAVPEPMTFWLVGIGLIGLWRIRRHADRSHQ